MGVEHEELAARAAAERGIARRPISGDEILARIMTALANEGANVLEEGKALRPGDIGGTYGGATASATIGVGVGANALIGGSGNHIVLQPLSIEANRGLNVAAGVASMTLVPAR